MIESSLSQMLRIAAIALVLCVALLPRQARSLEIRNVHHRPVRVDSDRDWPMRVDFDLIGENAHVVLRIFDGRELAVRDVASARPLGAGSHVLEWDGRDNTGQRVPNEAYHFVLVATEEPETHVIWDITDSTGGNRLRGLQAEFSSDRAAIEYRLAKHARVRARFGLAGGGPLMGTVVDWVPRGSGHQREPWNGLDSSGTIDLVAHPKLMLQVDAVSLPDNTIIVGRPTPRPTLIEGLPDDTPRRQARRPRRHTMHDYGNQPLESRRDFPVTIRLPDGTAERDSLPVVEGPVPIRIAMSSDAKRHLANQRHEAVFFVDGQYAFEMETAYLPVSWRWDPQDVPEGVHYITVNLRGYEGQFGISTVKVWVQHDPYDRPDVSASE